MLKKPRYKQSVKVTYYGYIYGNMVIRQPVIWRDSIRWTLAAVVLLLLDQSAFYRHNFCFYRIQPFSCPMTIFRWNRTLPFFKFSCFFVELFVFNFFALNIEQFSISQLGVSLYVDCWLDDYSVHEIVKNRKFL